MSVSPTHDRSLNQPARGAASLLTGATSAAECKRDYRLGMEIGKYVVTRRLGRGGMGIVYEAQDKVLRRKVAIKFFAEAVAVTRDAVRRFVQEARAAARLNHPNVVSVYEVGQRDGIYFLVMELVRGASVEEYLRKQGRFDWSHATRVTASACRALAAAHAALLIHRDVKPANLLLSAETGGPDHSWQVKLGDFGLAKLVDGAVSMATAADRVLGTPNYMSPEQCRSEALDPRTDLYSLGATYYSLLTARPPFNCDQPVQVMFAHCWSPIPDPRETYSAIPEACAEIVRRAMAKAASDRFQSAREMLASLEAAELDAAGISPPDIASPAIASGDGAPWFDGTLLDANRGAVRMAERDAPPFSRPLGPAGSARQGQLTGSSKALFTGATSPSPAESVRPSPRRRRLLIAGSLLLAAVGTAAAVVGPGRLHGTSSPAMGAPSTASARAPLSPANCRWSTDAGGYVSAVLFSPDSRQAIATVSDGQGGVRGWDASDGRPSFNAWPSKPTVGVTFLPASGGREFYAGRGTDVVRWSLVQEAQHNLPMHVSGDIMALAWGGLPAAPQVLAVQVKPHDANGGLKVFTKWDQELPFTMPGGRDVLSFCFLGDRGLLATGSTDAKIRIWSVELLDGGHGYPLMSTIDNEVSVFSLVSSADGAVIAAAGRQSARFFDANGGPISKVFRPNHSCRSLALSPDGMTAAIGSGSNSAGDVTLYDVNSGAMIAELTNFGGLVSVLAFSPDGSLLVTGSLDRGVKVWDLQKLLPDRAAANPATEPGKERQRP